MDTANGSLYDDPSLDLACIGNCAYSCLIDKKGQIIWSCFPRFDGDPIFCSLLKRSTSTSNDIGFFDIHMANFERSEQQYLRNSAILSTKLFDNRGNVLEIIDCVPKFIAHDRNYNPFMLIRKLTAVKGRPRVQIRLRPTFGYGWGTPEKTRGSNHIRYLLSNMTTRLTTNAPISYIIDEVLFEVEDPLYLVLMPDESLKATIQEMCETYLEKTLTWWRNWVKTLTIPLEWQEEVIRATIALRMAQFEETGAIVSAMTTSIPHSPKGGNYDYRYCWLRDTFWIVDTLNLIGATSTMEAYLKFLNNIVAEFAENPSGIQPVFGISLEKRIKEREMHRLPGYHGIGPVKIGNKDAETVQNDVYGSIILSLYTTFVDKRLGIQGDEILFRRMQGIGEMAINSYNQPDHGPQGMSTAIHTYSSVMCWAACDRLAKIAQLLKLDDRTQFWKDNANRIHEDIMKHAWNSKMNSFASTWDSEDIDHYLMFLPQLKFISASDPKFISTFQLVEKKLLRNGLLICRNPDDLVASVAGTFQYINTLSRMGREGDARQKFEKMLKFMVHKGMVSESIDPTTNQLWGNFPQNKAIVGLITCAIKLSKSWEEAF